MENSGGMTRNRAAHVERNMSALGDLAGRAGFSAKRTFVPGPQVSEGPEGNPCSSRPAAMELARRLEEPKQLLSREA